MNTVVDAVQSILSEDGFIVEALQRDVLNISAYAKEIQAEVEARTKKPVKFGTVVVSLSRIAEGLQQATSFTPKVTIDGLSVTTSLIELAYDKTDLVLSDISTINHSYIDNANAFFMMTSGVSEVTIICSGDIQSRITQLISQQPKASYQGLATISLRLSDKYMDTPNTIYSLVGIFAARYITILEIVSTYTEVTFLVYEKELETAIQALQAYQSSPKPLTSKP